MDKDLSKRQSQFYLVWTIVGVVVLLGMLVKGVMMAKYKKSGYMNKGGYEKMAPRDGMMNKDLGKPMMQQEGNTMPQNPGY